MTISQKVKSILIAAIVRAVRIAGRRLGLKAAIESQYADALTDLSKQDDDSDTLRDAIIALLVLWSLRAYQEGLRDSGIADPDTAMTDGDREIVQAWVVGQTVYAAGLAEAIAKANTLPEGAERDTAQADIERRIALWAASLAVLQLAGQSAGYTKQKADPMVTWKFDPTKEHCQTGEGKMGCEQLDGQRHPLSWFTSRGYIPREPSSPTLACGGWECGCGLYDDDGNRLL